MQNIGTIAIAVSFVILIGAAYAAWRDKRRDEDAEQERPADKSSQQPQGGGGPRPVTPK